MGIMCDCTVSTLGLGIVLSSIRMCYVCSGQTLIRQVFSFCIYINTSLKNVFSFIQSYEFAVVSTDVLEIDVRDKFVASRPSFTHFLGRARIPTSQLLRRSSV